MAKSTAPASTKSQQGGNAVGGGGGEPQNQRTEEALAERETRLQQLR